MRYACWALLAAAVALTGCSESKKDTMPPQPTAQESKLVSFDVEGIRAEAESLAQELHLDAMQRAELSDRLDGLLASKAFGTLLEQSGIQAVAAFRLGEGGAIVKVGEGDGRIAFVGQDERNFEIEARSFGATVGGSATWGVLLVAGLADPEALTGTYGGSVRSATAFEASGGVVRLSHGNWGHSLLMVGVSEGLSANAGRAKLVIAYKP